MTVSANAHVKTLTNVGDPLILQDGTPLAGIKITFQLVVFGSKMPTSVIDGSTGEVISSKQTSVITDDKGEFSITLWPNSRGADATAYRVTFSKYFKEFFILMPDGDSSLLQAKLAYSVGTGAVGDTELNALIAKFIGTGSLDATVDTVSSYVTLSDGTVNNYTIVSKMTYYTFGKILFVFPKFDLVLDVLSLFANVTVYGTLNIEILKSIVAVVSSQGNEASVTVDNKFKYCVGLNEQITITNPGQAQTMTVELNHGAIIAILT